MKFCQTRFYRGSLRQVQRNRWKISIFIFAASLFFISFQNCSEFTTKPINLANVQSLPAQSSGSSSSPGIDNTDLFLIIGQSNSVGQAPENLVSTVLQPVPDAWEFDANFTDLKPLHDPTGIPTESCGVPCYWQAKTHSFLPAFASQWKKRTERRSIFVPRGSSGAGLFKSSDISNVGWWTLFDDGGGLVPRSKQLYLNAKTDLVKAYKTARAQNISIGKVIVLWFQGESDAIAGTDTSAYASGLMLLASKLGDDFYTETGAKIDLFAIGQIGYFFNKYNETVITSHRDRVHNIINAFEVTQANYALSATPKILIASNYGRVATSLCQTGISTPGCETFDGIHYTTAAYEKIGTEFAFNLAKFLKYGRRPLDANSCQGVINSEECSANIPLYMWWMGTQYIYSNDPKEFDSLDAQGVRFAGLTGYLYNWSLQDNRMVRVYRARSRQSGSGSLDFVYGTESALSGNAFSELTPLGTCYANAMTGVTERLSLPGPSGRKEIICYVENHGQITPAELAK